MDSQAPNEIFLEVLSFADIDLDQDAVARRLRVSNKGLVKRVVDTARAVLAPRAAFRTSYVEEQRDGSVVVDGIRFNSRVLRRNLGNVGRVFPFVLTLGRAFDDAVDANEDMLCKYLLDEIGNMVLGKARRRLATHLRSTFALNKISFMAPGSLADWPIEQQKPLFQVLSGVESAIGVRLTKSCLMLPRKSVSGIYFPTEVSFLSCQLCPRDGCGGRQGRYDEEKARTYGILKK